MTKRYGKTMFAAALPALCLDGCTVDPLSTPQFNLDYSAGEPSPLLRCAAFHVEQGTLRSGAAAGR